MEAEEDLLDDALQEIAAEIFLTRDLDDLRARLKGALRELVQRIDLSLDMSTLRVSLVTDEAITAEVLAPFPTDPNRVYW